MSYGLRADIHRHKASFSYRSNNRNLATTYQAIPTLCCGTMEQNKYKIMNWEIQRYHFNSSVHLSRYSFIQISRFCLKKILGVRKPQKTLWRCYTNTLLFIMLVNGHTKCFEENQILGNILGPFHTNHMHRISYNRYYPIFDFLQNILYTLSQA